MFNTVLLTIDLTREASWKKALPQAVELVGASKGTLHLMSVVPEPGMPLVEGFFPPDFEEKAVAAASKALDYIVKENVPAGIKVKQHLSFGKIHTKMLEAIEENDINANAYFYTDVDEFFLAERHMRHHLGYMARGGH